MVISENNNILGKGQSDFSYKSGAANKNEVGSKPRMSTIQLSNMNQ